MSDDRHGIDRLHAALARLFDELTTGADPKAGWALNPGDPGLLASLDRLSAAEASEVNASGSSVAAHVDHLRYGIGLLIRWAEGEDPFQDADYSASWKRVTVPEDEWTALRSELREATRRWLDHLARPRERAQWELTAVASVAHLAYHLGAIRQLHPRLRGPPARD
jgi:hypothetical protein